MNLQRAKELRAAFLASEAGATQALRLHVDAAGDLFKLLGERVAVNARQANLLVQLAAAGASNPSMAPDGLHLFAWHYDSLSPHTDLETLLKQMPDGTEIAAAPGDPEQLFAQERRLVEERRILPLALLPEYVGIRPTVHNWNASPSGDWRLADVWLESEDATSSKTAGGPQRENSTVRNPGAKP